MNALFSNRWRNDIIFKYYFVNWNNNKILHKYYDLNKNCVFLTEAFHHFNSKNPSRSNEKTKWRTKIWLRKEYTHIELIKIDLIYNICIYKWFLVIGSHSWNCKKKSRDFHVNIHTHTQIIIIIIWKLRLITSEWTIIIYFWRHVTHSSLLVPLITSVFLRQNFRQMFQCEEKTKPFFN